MKDLYGSSIDKEGAAEVCFIGVLPPPVNGMTLMTAHVVETLALHGSVRVFAISGGGVVGRWPLLWRLAKAVKVIQSLGVLLCWGRARGRRLYLVANSGAGILQNVAQAVVARALGYEVWLHHQVYSYVRRRDWRMVWLCAILGGNCRHVLLCERMARRFAELYPRTRIHVEVPNFPIDLPDARGRAERVQSAGRRVLRVGHISNLSVEKGFDTVLETFDHLRSKELAVHLVLAGPFRSRLEARMLKEAQRRHPETVDYRGPVSGGEKLRFFEAVDVLLFPTRYDNEAFPIVVTEALHMGIPVITTDRACISGMVGETGGLVVPEGRDFIEAASELVGRWCSDPPLFESAVRDATRRGVQLCQEARRRFEPFVLAVGRGAGETGRSASDSERDVFD